MMRRAYVAVMPGNRCSCAAVALFRSTSGVARVADAERGFCAQPGVTNSATANPSADNRLTLPTLSESSASKPRHFEQQQLDRPRQRDLRGEPIASPIAAIASPRPMILGVRGRNGMTGGEGQLSTDPAGGSPCR